MFRIENSRQLARCGNTVRSVWFILLVSFIELVLFNQTNETNLITVFLNFA